MNYSMESIKQGRMNQEASAETPETFATIEGASQPRGGAELSKGNNRMAGEVGARAISIMNDPAEQARTKGWMNRFGMSNQGMEWNQARMGVPTEE